MIIGQTLHGDDEGTFTYYSPWFPRGGNRGVFTVNTIASHNLNASTGFKITVQTKNSEEGDGEADPANDGTLTVTLTGGQDLEESWTAGAGTGDATKAGLKELVRFKYEVNGGTGSGWVHFRMLAPQWFTN